MSWWWNGTEEHPHAEGASTLLWPCSCASLRLASPHRLLRGCVIGSRVADSKWSSPDCSDLALTEACRVERLESEKKWKEKRAAASEAVSSAWMAGRKAYGHPAQQRLVRKWQCR
jgi:hypothetical protein